MISWLRGRPLRVQPEEITLDVSGVGYEIRITLPVYYALGEAPWEEVSLHIHTHVREGTLQLYGFLEATEKTAFRLLLSISGVGPKLAVTVLSGLSVQDLGRAISGNDCKRFEKIPGIGRKTAERLLLELRDRWKGLDQPESSDRTPTVVDGEEALSALLNLGYPERAARRAVEEALQQQPDAPLAGQIRAALARLL